MYINCIDFLHVWHLHRLIYFTAVNHSDVIHQKPQLGHTSKNVDPRCGWQGREQSAILNQKNMSVDSKMEKKRFLIHLLKALNNKISIEISQFMLILFLKLSFNFIQTYILAKITDFL